MLNAEVYFHALAQHSRDLVCVLGPDRVMRYVSDSSCRLLGWEPEEMVGLPPYALVHPDDLFRVSTAAQAVTRGVEFSGPALQYRLRRKDGQYLWVETTSSLVRDPRTGDVVEILLIVRDVSFRMERIAELEKLTFTDGLTGLLNRRGFDAALAAGWDRTLQGGTQLSLLMLDIDHFKLFNDTYGHQAGDDCLRAVAAVTAARVSCAGGEAARYGGEELAAILPSTPHGAAVCLAEEIRRAVASLRLPGGTRAGAGHILSVSLGVTTALARDGGSVRNPETLLMAADNALYRAKRDGRNQVAASLLMAQRADCCTNGSLLLPG